ncbi:MAG: S46 family peptidase [Saprospiraceae bacterium]
MSRFLFVSLFSLISILSHANEGMWIPLFLKQLNEAEMKGLGMKLNAEDIYSVNKSSLKDAICQFGGGCTAELISNSGLLLTNHHCGFDAIQNHSTLEHNYLENGFWSKNNGQELQNQGLTATFIIRIEDVSAAALLGISADMSEKDRLAAINKNISMVTKGAQREAWQEVFVRPFYEGNQYFMFVTETYKDVRLVGAPPSSIGKFGNDTDNWAYPRHTGDFSLFRIYADKNNRPAEYSADNVPYTPKHFLPISLDGVEKGDFSMVYGFPGRTQEYLPAIAVEQIVNILNPAKIAIRDKTLKIMDEDMRADPATKILLAARYAGISNAWKKWRGESLGLTKSKALEKKKTYEKQFSEALRTNENWNKNYSHLLDDLNKVYKDAENYLLLRDLYRETFTNCLTLNWANNINTLLRNFDKNDNKAFEEKKKDLQAGLAEFFKEYSVPNDKKVFAALTEMYWKSVPAEYIGEDAKSTLAKNKTFQILTDKIFSKTILTDKSKVAELLAMPTDKLVKKLRKDPLSAFTASLYNTFDTKVNPKLAELQPQLNRLQRQYMKAQMEVFEGTKTFFPDANSTLRITYGKVNGFQPKDGVEYTPFTYLNGVMEKYIPGDYEFDVPQKLRDLYAAKDYGQYGVDGKMPVCFLGMNHTTGGNSGSPALDAYGNLIGLNFDRVWEGTMSDINYDPALCRNIMMDARYLLFIVDKFAGAGHLIEEMKLVHPKKKM